MIGFTLSFPSLLATVALLYAVYYWYRHRNIPGGPRGVPFIGYAPFFGRNPQDKFLTFKEKYGKMFSIYLGPRLTIVLNDYEAVKEAFLGQAEIFSGRSPGFVFEFLSLGEDGKTHGILLAEGEKLKKTRRFVLQSLRDLGMGKKRIQISILEEAAVLVDIFRKNADQPFNPLPTLTASVANVICALSWGRRYDHEDEDFKKILSGFDIIPTFLSQASVLLGYPMLRHLPGKLRRSWENLVIAVRWNQKFTDGIIEEHINEYQEGEPRDYVDAFVKQQRAEVAAGVDIENDESIFNKEELRKTVGSFFGAGSETTTMTLYWAILFMAHHQVVQKRVQKEIADNIPMGGPVTVEDKAKLPYVEAVCREIQRCANVTPLGVLRCNLEETTLLGYRIPKRSNIMVNFLAIFRDPALWDEPSRFMPERFLDKEGKLYEPPFFMPFSIGKRACIGESLARMEIFLFFSNILQNFNILPCEEFPLPSLEEYTTGISCRPLPYKIRLTTRETDPFHRV
ncbi:hypothetical protein RvY_19273 [Ramazzottius varieornatus]|uniref:Cytochrome P450 n=1 Tax=Ramazzottius varieornatus TaxID=947166 RepID=A0A1D1WC72_RAMVA|nr:hypothetical protein RvY_19273 [Ramazzottius varieornatus]